MSLILDALRKSERARQRSLTGKVSASDAPPGRGYVPVPWATLIGILLIANAVALAVIFWRGHNAPASSAPVAAPLAAKPTPTVEVPAPVDYPQIRSLAAEAAAVNALTATSSKPIATPPAATPAATAVANPASTATAVSELPSATVNVGNSPGNAPPLDTLPLAFQQSLPPLHLDVHGYAQNPADRFVIINMQRYQKGDTLKEGPRVIAIVPDGVVLEYQSQQFLLPRP